MSIYIGGVLVANSPFTISNVERARYNTGVGATATSIPVPGGTLVTGTLYRIISLGTVNFVAMGAAGQVEGIIFQYNGAAISGSGGSVWLMRTNVYPDMIAYDASRGAGVISNLSDGNTSGGRQLLPIYIDGNQVTVFRPGQINRPVIRYIVESGGVPQSTIIGSLGRGTNDLTAKMTTVVIQAGGGGGAGGNDSEGFAPFRGGGGGGAGGLVIVDVDFSQWSSAVAGSGGVGGSINQSPPGNATNGTNSTINGPFGETISGLGGVQGTHSSANPRLGVGGSGGTFNYNPSGLINSAIHTATGGAGGNNNVAGTSRTGLTATTRSYIGSRIITGSFTSNNIRYYKYILTTSGTGFILVDNGAILNRAGGTVISHGTTTLAINERGGGGGASHYGKGGDTGSTTAGQNGAIGGSGGGGGRSANIFNQASRRAGGAGGRGFVMFFA
jgi:hypothetical protein